MSQTDDYRAVALCYDGETVPQVSATGTGELGRAITALAQQHGVPIMQSPYLTELLSSLDNGNDIPADLYVTIAEVIAFAWMLSGRFPPDWDSERP